MTAPILLWLRRDLRLADHPALSAACAAGGPVIPVFLKDTLEGLGAAPRFRHGLAIEAFAEALEAQGSRLTLRSGAPLEALRALIRETGARGVFWSRAYDPVQQETDRQVKAALKASGFEARSFAGHLLFEPWDVETKTGGHYKVYSPFWRAVKDRHPGAPLPPPAALPAPASWPAGEALADWDLARAMRRGAAVLRPHCAPGERAAQDRLEGFLVRAIGSYKSLRDFPAKPATSGLSEHLTYGEISPRQIWAAGARALHEGAGGAEHFLKELVWREFAYHLLHNAPELPARCWRPEWESFPWRRDPAHPDFIAWSLGQTGIAMVDAGMRELWVTGRMHNRVRMIAASFLTKHLMMDWRLGLDWFADQLIDWDPAANAMGWQWVAGCGPDAAPYFRVFNPDGQGDKFDKDRAYRRRFLAEESAAPEALAYFDAIPARHGLRPGPAPRPITTLAEGRARALAAYEAHRSAAQ